MNANIITSPDDPALAELCARLAELADELDQTGGWPAEQLKLCGEYGVYQWFLDPAWGGQAWSEEDILRGYMALSSACLTTTFIITQRSGACRRIAGSSNRRLQQRLLPALASGTLFSTVAISHLTTSRQHLSKPVLRAVRVADGYVLDGFSPWVTGAAHADTIVVAASMIKGDKMEDLGSPSLEPTGEQLLVALPTDLPGVSTPEPAKLVGISASHTGQLCLAKTQIQDQQVIAGPDENVMTSGQGGTTGGLQTSTLALGLARAAIDFIALEAKRREDLQAPLEALQAEYNQINNELFALVCDDPICSNEQLRKHANSLVLRAAQAALVAAKGTGYQVGHPTGRWCREALFFLVWSCPQPVVHANLCELAGILD
ncbi:MAG: acyl-CoA dehydrogenase family protein [Pirellulales bacterium]